MRTHYLVLGIVGVLGLTGCRTSTQVTEVPRVDLSLQAGNRGYLVGTAPSPGERKTTRQMAQVTLELPNFYTPKQGQAPIGLPAEVEAGIEPLEVGTVSAAPVPGAFDTYVVQRGETLWAIAAKPEVYGKATRWRQIFEANRDQLGDPNQVKAGMTLKIPRTLDDPSTTYGDEGITVKK